MDRIYTIDKKSGCSATEHTESTENGGVLAAEGTECTENGVVGLKKGRVK